MTHSESKLEQYQYDNLIKTYCRYVDALVNFVNSLHHNIKFTCEKENDFEISISRCKDYSRHIGQLSHWHSCQANKYKI